MKLTQVVKILDLSPIEGADRIEKAKVLGWEVVVRKGLHKVGDKVLFIFPDTSVPKQLLDETYVGDEKVRLKTIRMKGQYSAGLIIPLRDLVSLPKRLNERGDMFIFEGDEVATIDETGYSEIIQEGRDLSGWLGITKWEAPIPTQLSGVALGGFPSYVSKTDEDNFRSFPDALEEIKEDRFKDQEFYATVKNDGTSATFILDPFDNNFKVCSRNLELANNDKNSHWRIAVKHHIEDVLRESGRHLAIQGEICGEGIQKNPMNLKGIHFFIFLIKDLDENRWLSWDEVQDFVNQDRPYLKMETVREIFRIKAQDIDWNILQNRADCVEYEKGKLAEGIVLRPVNPIPSNVLGKSWWSVKILNRIYDSKKG